MPAILNTLVVSLVVSQTQHNVLYRFPVCLQCFDTVGWAAGRASGL